MPFQSALPVTSVKYDINQGLNDAKAASDLEAGMLTAAQGIYYKRGSDEAFFKSGRAAYNETTLGIPGGLYYCEFTNATNQIVARAGSAFYSGTAALTSAWTTLGTDLDPNPLGLWGTFANGRYLFNDGVTRPWIYEFRADTSTYLYRRAGLDPPTEQPTVTPQVDSGGGDQIILTSATASSNGDKQFAHASNFVDGDANTYANVTINDGGNVARIFAVGFTGTGAGVRTDWIIAATYETGAENGGRSTTRVDYTTDGGTNYTNYETVNDIQSKHTVQISLLGQSLDSANLGIRIVHTKNGNAGKSSCLAYDARAFNTAGSGNNTVADGLIYWVTEKVDYLGIESVAGPRSSSTGPITAASTVQISLPATPVNALTTHYVVYRTENGGAFPTGTAVGTYAIGTPYAYDNGPLNQIASTNTYGAFTVAGLFYERDIVPPTATVMATYQNLICVAPVATPGKIRYSAPDFTESFPLINVINMASDRDDTIQALVPLSSQLGVFMKGRCRRIDHLPLPSDPTFDVAPEDFAPDHGLESKKGWAYFVPPGGLHSHIAYCARDGIRVTDLYSTTIVTNNLDWAGTVSIPDLASSRMINNASMSRLEFYFIPTAAFRTANGWNPDVNGVLWLHYQLTDNYNPQALRVTVQAANVADALAAPISIQDEVFLMSSGVRVGQGSVWVDNQGSTDLMLAIDTLGTVYRRITTGQVYPDDTGRFARGCLKRLILDADADTFTHTVTVTAGRDDLGLEWTETREYLNTEGGAKPLWFNISGQWHQVSLVADSATTVPARVRNFSWLLELLGEFV